MIVKKLEERDSYFFWGKRISTEMLTRKYINLKKKRSVSSQECEDTFLVSELHRSSAQSGPNIFYR